MKATPPKMANPKLLPNENVNVVTVIGNTTPSQTNHLQIVPLLGGVPPRAGVFTKKHQIIPNIDAKK